MAWFLFAIGNAFSVWLESWGLRDLSETTDKVMMTDLGCVCANVNVPTNLKGQHISNRKRQLCRFFHRPTFNDNPYKNSHTVDILLKTGMISKWKFYIYIYQSYLPVQVT